MIVSHVSMRDGLLLELAREVTGKEDESLLAGRDPFGHGRWPRSTASIWTTPATWPRWPCGCSTRFSRTTGCGRGSGCCCAWRRLLHEVGGFVSSRAHHKHSEYLIANAEIFGLNRSEIVLVSLVARYHRRSVPRSSHPSYMALPRESRVVVNKLAALLRVADAMIRGHRRRAADIRFQRQRRRTDRLHPRRRRSAAGTAGHGRQGGPLGGHLRRENPAGRSVGETDAVANCGHLRCRAMSAVVAAFMPSSLPSLAKPQRLLARIIHKRL